MNRSKRAYTCALPALLLNFGLLSQPARAERAYAIDSRVLLIRFDTNSPHVVESSRAIRGLQPGESILGIDFRPANGKLYGLGSSSRVYTIDTETAAAAEVGTGPFTPRLQGTEFGFDFNPTVDRIRVVSSAGQNLRLHPDTGAVAAVDLALNFEDSRRPNIVGSAYTNSVAGATTTTLYGIDSETRALVTQAPPNDGKLNPVGTLQIDMSDLVGFDISPRTGSGYLVSRVRGAAASVVYEVTLSSGSVHLLGLIDGFDQISAVAIPGN